jgi:hypothetical protein
MGALFIVAGASEDFAHRCTCTSNGASQQQKPLLLPSGLNLLGTIIDT